MRVRNAKGEMIPLSAMAEIAPNMAPVRVRHHNQLEASTITYNLAKDVSQDIGTKLVENAAIAVGLPEGVRVEWTGQNQRLQQAKSNGMVLLIGAIVAMYIVLGILYESLGHPLTILSTLPAAGMGDDGADQQEFAVRPVQHADPADLRQQGLDQVKLATYSA